MKNLAAKADALTKRADQSLVGAGDYLRDWLDIETSSELDCPELDILAECVAKRRKS